MESLQRENGRGGGLTCSKWDYAAYLAVSVTTRFSGPLAPSEGFKTITNSQPHLPHSGHVSTDLGVKSIFPRFRAYKSLGDQMLSGWGA
jgi:hypothetical protein